MTLLSPTLSHLGLSIGETFHGTSTGSERAANTNAAVAVSNIDGYPPYLYENTKFDEFGDDDE